MSIFSYIIIQLYHSENSLLKVVLNTIKLTRLNTLPSSSSREGGELGSATFVDVAGETEILVSNENGRGIALSDLNNDDHLDIICGNWEGNHRIFLQLKAKSARHFN
jgi:hypothetical protein